tara:strand:+ start:2090 stop:2665 length:576 start_codon:yes stop_codon:yes gene_type:complete
MIAYKKKYFLYIENTKDIDLSNLKLPNKFVIIYRNQNKSKDFNRLLAFRRKCKVRKIEFYVANNFQLMLSLKADGLYISSYNKSLNLARFKKSKFKIIGSVHNIKEINLKKQQGCESLIFSRLFKTNYKNKIDYMGIIKFNLVKLHRKENLVPLGGIRLSNLNKLNSVNSDAFAILSEVKKKPAKIFNRLF